MANPTIECFLLEPTNRFWVYLRRYSTHTKHPCTGGGYHNAETLVAEIESETVPVCHDAGTDHLDPRWPTQCGRCSYTFADEDTWQFCYEGQYLGPNGQKYTTKGPLHAKVDKSLDAPPGAIWRAPWLEECGIKGPDGKCYILRTPGGDWIIDTSTSCWTRTGEAPRLSAQPSIVMGEKPDGSCLYRGVLQDGALLEV